MYLIPPIHGKNKLNLIFYMLILFKQSKWESVTGLKMKPVCLIEK